MFWKDANAVAQSLSLIGCNERGTMIRFHKTASAAGRRSWPGADTSPGKRGGEKTCSGRDSFLATFLWLALSDSKDVAYFGVGL